MIFATRMMTGAVGIVRLCAFGLIWNIYLVQELHAPALTPAALGAVLMIWLLKEGPQNERESPLMRLMIDATIYVMVIVAALIGALWL